MKVELSFDRYYDYEELTTALENLQAAYPELMQLESLGKTPQGRNIWAVTITGPAKPADTKPGYLIDASHHAGEVTGTMTALYTVWYLVTRYGDDRSVTRLLDETSVYVLPRLSADGVETYLKTPALLRSAPRPYPLPESEYKEGLYPEDIDGNGHILLMRMEDERGEWTPSRRDPRLMIRRGPDQEDGTFYRMEVEGLLRQWPAPDITTTPAVWGLDFNRNYPVAWEPDYRQRGAGPYPLSEPETRMVAHFVLQHPNIAGSTTLHTSGGVILHPPGTRKPEEIPKHDLAIFKAIGAMGTEETGYPCIPVSGGFVLEGENPVLGATDDWLYEHQGIPSYTVELWNLLQRSGVENLWPRTIRTPRQQEEDMLLLLQWNDRELEGKGFVDWTPFDHPQLGAVEIGGWLPKFVVQNPPAHLLAAECQKNMRFSLRHARTLPRLRLRQVKAERLGTDTYEVSAIVDNMGYLPTYLTKRRLELPDPKPVYATLEGEGFTVVSKNKRLDLGHLEGRSAKDGGFMLGYYFSGPAKASAREARWIIRITEESKPQLHMRAWGEKAGQTSADVIL